MVLFGDASRRVRRNSIAFLFVARVTHKSLRERLGTVAGLAASQGLPLRLNSYSPPGKAGAVDVSASGYGYSVEITTSDGCSGVELLSESGLTAKEADQFLRGMAVALDLRRWLEHRRILAPRIPFESAESRELELYVQNDNVLWPRLRKVLAKRYKSGDFTLDDAILTIQRGGCLPAAKRYLREFGTMTDKFDSLFPKGVRMAAAESLARHLSNEFKLGNF